MDTPNYLASLPFVAQDHGTPGDLGKLGDLLCDQWAMLEEMAKANAYDILQPKYGGLSGLSNMARLLYQIPGADWNQDVATLRAKDADYGGSWHRRGGQGAFMMLARKWDRIEKAFNNYGGLKAALSADARAEGIIDDINDLRCYLLLVLSWHRAREMQEMPF